jgi:hypothetical protein
MNSDLAHVMPTCACLEVGDDGDVRLRVRSTIRTSGNIPNENEWKLLSDVNLDKYTGQVDVEELYFAGTIAFRCLASNVTRCFDCAVSYATRGMSVRIGTLATT